MSIDYRCEGRVRLETGGQAPSHPNDRRRRVGVFGFASLGFVVLVSLFAAGVSVLGTVGTQALIGTSHPFFSEQYSVEELELLREGGFTPIDSVSPEGNHYANFHGPSSWVHFIHSIVIYIPPLPPVQHPPPPGPPLHLPDSHVHSVFASEMGPIVIGEYSFEDGLGGGSGGAPGSSAASGKGDPPP